MRIRSIEVGNFKSLVKFQLNLQHFTCLIGLNGAGKSTILQFIDFLGQQIKGDINAWLDLRQWRPTEVLSALTPLKSLSFEVSLLDDRDRELLWKASFNPARGHCTTETIRAHDAQLTVSNGHYSITRQRQNEKIPFDYQGSIISQLRGDILPKSLQQFKEFFLSSESLDMLTPEYLRRRTRSADGSLGHGGRNLSSFVYELGLPGRRALSTTLRKVYPRLRGVYAKALRAGWKQLHITEIYKDKLRTEARHINDGMLRLIAILSELASSHGLIQFDEIENGINPEIVQFVIDTLLSAPQQVVVTTHSPMILNYLDDDTARDAVVYIYKTARGYTRAIPFFAIPSLKDKLEIMGPGEAFVDTNLTALDQEIVTLSKGR
jgi:predicted ATPase